MNFGEVADEFEFVVRGEALKLQSLNSRRGRHNKGRQDARKDTSRFFENSVLYANVILFKQ